LTLQQCLSLHQVNEFNKSWFVMLAGKVLSICENVSFAMCGAFMSTFQLFDPGKSKTSLRGRGLNGLNIFSQR
ncbi:hypothetical protein, partial [Klebsiella pneumoniae]|uniref:hypothetical protein n=1 Tax=Klebsiella pneumoniae TaxID=573 RepID=UPI000CAF574D